MNQLQHLPLGPHLTWPRVSVSWMGRPRASTHQVRPPARCSRPYDPSDSHKGACTVMPWVEAGVSGHIRTWILISVLWLRWLRGKGIFYGNRPARIILQMKNIFMYFFYVFCDARFILYGAWGVLPITQVALCLQSRKGILGLNERKVFVFFCLCRQQKWESTMQGYESQHFFHLPRCCPTRLKKMKIIRI